jgi:hypothetical protein
VGNIQAALDTMVTFITLVKDKQSNSSECARIVTPCVHPNLKMAVFWIVAPCSLVDVYLRFRSACCLYHWGDHCDDVVGKPLKRR